jgi:acetylcholinesterase
MDEFCKIWVIITSLLSATKSIIFENSNSNPTPPTGQRLPFKWLPVEPIPEKAISFDLDCLNIDEQVKMIQNPDKDRIDFWRNVFKKWNKSFLNPKL